VNRFVLGVDLGQANDYTALVVLERVGKELHARHIERLRLGTSYPAQVARIVDLVSSPELARDVTVAVDGTGVGPSCGGSDPNAPEDTWRPSGGRNDHWGHRHVPRGWSVVSSKT
jgi:hypothetical protein